MALQNKRTRKSVEYASQKGCKTHAFKATTSKQDKFLQVSLYLAPIGEHQGHEQELLEEVQPNMKDGAEPAPVQHQHFPPSIPAAAAAAGQKRWEARGGGGRAASEGQDVRFRVYKKAQVMKVPWGPSVRYGGVRGPSKSRAMCRPDLPGYLGPDGL
eukprot:1149111-Pelagomonas_calceolata.AAC.1